jgi:hypothetical protein
MGGAVAIPPAANQPMHIERPARVLLGWLTAQEAEICQSGRGARTPLQEDAERAETCTSSRRRAGSGYRSDRRNN